MILMLFLAAIAFGLASLLGAPRGTWRFILLAVALAALATQLLPVGHRLRADLLGSAKAFAWLIVALIPLTAYALWVRRLRRASSGRPKPTQHPMGLVQIAEDRALTAETAAALDAAASKALVPSRPLSLAWRAADGSIAGHLRLREAGSTAEIEMLHVAPAHRRTGIGSNLLTAAETEARARGLTRLAVAPGSWQAPEFFTRAGYLTTAAHDLGKGARRLRMERPLT